MAAAPPKKQYSILKFIMDISMIKERGRERARERYGERKKERFGEAERGR